MIVNKNDPRLQNIIRRGEYAEKEYLPVVQEILNNVKNNGDKALLEYTKRFDRFDATGNITDANGIKSIKWKDSGDGVKLIEYKVKITGDTYFRLRGTNHGLNVPGKTDVNGNPLEATPAENSKEAAKVAFEDLWFYSNPIFVRK